MRFSIFYPSKTHLNSVSLDGNGDVWWTSDYAKAKKKAAKLYGIVVDGEELVKRWSEVVDGTWTPSEVRR